MDHRERMAGVISLVQEMKERWPRYLWVEVAGKDGNLIRVCVNNNLAKVISTFIFLYKNI